MLELLSDPQAWIALATLTALELVLGIDNIIFISILVVGVMLIAAGFDHEVPKGYVYFAMAFAVAVELLNIRTRKRAEKPVRLRKRYVRKDE